MDVGDDALAEMEVLVGFDDDLAGEATRISNRIRGLLTGIHPALEHAIGPKIAHPAVLEILSRCGGPTGIAKAGRVFGPFSTKGTDQPVRGSRGHELELLCRRDADVATGARGRCLFGNRGNACANCVIRVLW